MDFSKHACVRGRPVDRAPYHITTFYFTSDEPCVFIRSRGTCSPVCVLSSNVIRVVFRRKKERKTGNALRWSGNWFRERKRYMYVSRSNESNREKAFHSFHVAVNKRATRRNPSNFDAYTLLPLALPSRGDLSPPRSRE